MKKLVTIILSAIILCLAIVIAGVNRSDASKLGGREPLVGLSTALAAESIVLEKAGVKVHMVKTGDQWRFIEPEQDWIDPNSMNNLLVRMGNLTIVDALGKGELKKPEMSLENLGLGDDNGLFVRLKSRGQDKKVTEQVFAIGNEAPRADSVYVEQGGKSKSVSVVDGNLLPILEYPFDSLRQRRLVTIPSQMLVQIGVKTSKSEFALQRTIKSKQTTPWQVIYPVAARADQRLVETMIDDVLNLQLTGEVEEGAHEVPEQIPEGALLFQFQYFGSDQPIVLYLSPDESDPSYSSPLYSAIVSDRPNLIFQHSSTIESLLPATSKALRDRRLGSVPLEVLDSIGILPNDVILKADRKKQGVDWQVLFNNQFVPADFQRVNTLLNAVSEPLIIDFIDDGDPKDYNIGMMRLGFNFKIPPSQNPTGKTGEEKITRTLELGFKEDSEGRRRLYASYINDSQIFELDEGFAALMPTQPVRWRSPRVTRFSHIHVVSIERKLGKAIRGGEDLEMVFDLSRGLVTGVTGGKPVSLDQNSVMLLRNQLAALKARNWVFETAVAFKVLEDPAALFMISVKERDPATGLIKTKKYNIKLTEAPNGIVYGQLNEDQDLFIIEPALYRQLIQPLNGR